MTDASGSRGTAQAIALVEVVPLGNINQTAVAVVAANLQAILGLNADVASPEPEPEYALVPARGQYDAGLILSELSKGGGNHPLRLGLTRRDLCLPFLNHVFGEAQMGGRAAVVSLSRLGQGPDGTQASRGLLLERAAKVALHEAAHVLGLVHCRAPRCLMNFSAGLDRLDRLDLSLCPVCRAQLDQRRAGLLAGERASAD